MPGGSCGCFLLAGFCLVAGSEVSRWSAGEKRRRPPDFSGGLGDSVCVQLISWLLPGAAGGWSRNHWSGTRSSKRSDRRRSSTCPALRTDERATRSRARRPNGRDGGSGSRAWFWSFRGFLVRSGGGKPPDPRSTVGAPDRVTHQSMGLTPVKRLNQRVRYTA